MDKIQEGTVLFLAIKADMIENRGLDSFHSLIQKLISIEIFN